jgi:hypothetical protein
MYLGSIRRTDNPVLARTRVAPAPTVDLTIGEDPVSLESTTTDVVVVPRRNNNIPTTVELPSTEDVEEIELDEDVPTFEDAEGGTELACAQARMRRGLGRSGRHSLTQIINANRARAREAAALGADNEGVEEERRCRICLCAAGEDTEDSTFGMQACSFCCCTTIRSDLTQKSGLEVFDVMLKDVCDCNGSIALIHATCLMHWIQLKTMGG